METNGKVKKIILSLRVATEKIKNWCAYQERSHFETKAKLFEFGLSTIEVDEIIVVLISENFLNEERFAEAFSRGKFRIKHWGKNKIKAELKHRKISEYSIKKALKQIDDDDYYATLKKIIAKKTAEIKEKNEFKKKHKIYQYAVSRGFESNLVSDILKLQTD